MAVMQIYNPKVPLEPLNADLFKFFKVISCL